MQGCLRLLNQEDSQNFKKLRLESLLMDKDSWLSSLEEEKDQPDYFFSNKITFAISAPIFGYWGYFENGQLLGYAQIAVSYWKKRMHIATIFDVCVTPSARKKGVGNRILNFIIDKAKTSSNLEMLQLWVTSRNLEAIKFYEGLGFTKTATNKKSVKETDGNYQDEYLYTLKLK